MIGQIMVDDGPSFAEELVDAGNYEDADLVLAKQIAEIIKLAENTGLRVPIPDNARRFAERKLTEFLDDAASVARANRELPYITDRSELDPAAIFDSNSEWSQGLTIDELNELIEDFEDEDPEWLMEFPTLHARGPLAEMLGIRSQVTEDPLAGHYNRFLPMKLSLRVLLNMILGSERYDGETFHAEMAPIHIDEFRSKALGVAVYAKKWFSELDEQRNIAVGEEITVGLPEDKTKSRERFLSQFVGSVRKKGEGSLCEMGLIRVDEEGIVSMTREGLNFTQMFNPIIDAPAKKKVVARMSHNEQFYMMQHIQQFLVGEWDFMVEVARLIESGSNTPSTMDKELITSKEWGDAKSSLMRNGVLSRMQELGFVERLKEGRNITYHLTENGKERLIEGNLWANARVD